MPLFPSSKKGLGYKPDPKMESPDFGRLGLTLAGDLKEYSLEHFIPVLNGIRVILDQGATSSCVAHAFVNAIMIAEQRAGLSYIASAVLYPYYFARREEGNGPIVFDQGTFLRTCGEGLGKFGVCPAQYWAFSESSLKVNRRPDYKAMSEAHARAAGRYARIYEYATDRVQAIKSALVSGHAVAFGTVVAESFLDSHGPLSITVPKVTERIAGGHAMCIVGWQTVDGETWFRVLNSWGNTWRDGGLVLMHEDYITSPVTNDLHVVYGWKRLQEAV